MLAFDKSNANLLKELLYRSYVHDAKLESIRYDSEDKCIKIALTNSTFGVAYDLTFKNVEIALAIKGKEYGSSETLVSLTVEKDFSYLQVYIPKCGAFAQDSLYLLFQMFSGDELHIVAHPFIAGSIRTFILRGIRIFTMVHICSKKTLRQCLILTAMRL